MDIRYLKKEERAKTRQMWEEVFSSDSRSFVDYYYRWKTARNEILVLEEESKILSMIQLNPYDIYLNREIVPSNYIVGVATDPRHRHKGYMRMLINRMLADMNDNGEAFTFLMPAAEAIYKPFGFHYIYKRVQCTAAAGDISSAVTMLAKKAGLPELEPLECRGMTREDIPELVSFSNRILRGRYDVFAKRDRVYYETLLEEVRCENGEILLFYRGGVLSGYCCYLVGDEVEAREPVCERGEEIPFALALLDRLQQFGKNLNFLGADGIFPEELLAENGGVIGYEENPIIMARIVDIRKFMGCFCALAPVDLKIRIVDRILPENHRTFKVWSAGEGTGFCIEESDEREDIAVDVGRFTAFMFGYITCTELLEENPFCPESAGEGTGREKVLANLANIARAGKIFLNEIV